MKNFDQKIRKKYAQEVNPVYTEKAWDAFASKAGIKGKSPRRRIWWVFMIGFLMTMIIAGYYFLTDRNIEPTLAYSTEKEHPSLENIISQGPEIDATDLISNSDFKESQSRAIPVEPEEIHENGESYVEEIEEKGNLIATVINESEQIDIKESRRSSTEPVQKNPSLQTINESKVSVLDDQEDLAGQNEMDHELSAPVTRDREFIIVDGLTFYNLLPSSIGEPTAMNETNSPILVFDEGSKRINIELLLGAGWTRHRSVLNERQQNAQLNLSYFLGNRINIISSIGYFHQAFESRVLYQNLGLRSSNYQPRSVKLDRVNSNAESVEMAMGLEFLPVRVGKFSLLNETSLAYSHRFNQDLVYEFNNGESFIPDIEEGVEPLDMNRWSLRIGTGVKMAVNTEWGLITRAYYQKPIFNDGIQYPSQWRWMLGIEKRW